MKDAALYQIIQKYRGQGVDVALVILVETIGSTPQPAGAKMVVLPDGRTVGTAGGGCVEAQIKSAALEVLLGDRHSRTITVSLTAPIGQTGGDVCGGTVTALIEYLPAVANAG